MQIVQNAPWINFMSNQNLFQGINNRNFFEAKHVSTFIVPFPKDITRRDENWVFSNVHYMYIDNCTSFKLARVPRVPLYPIEDIVHFFLQFQPFIYNFMLQSEYLFHPCSHSL